MNFKATVAILVSCVFVLDVFGQQLEILHEGGSASIRGLSVYKNTIWVSGSAGTIGRSEDKGKTWQWMQVKGFEKTEFRDVEALNENTAIIMGIASPANILKTNDGGKNWKVVYSNKHPSMFLDAMSFSTKGKGVIIGDPVDGKVFAAKTNGGDQWTETSEWNLPKAISGEAFFAASGTNVVLSNKKYFLVSGGKVSRLFMNEKSIKLPLQQGKETTGANSVAVFGKKIAVAGGDFMQHERTDSVFAISNNKGKTWQLPTTPPTGYRSCVCFVNKKTLVACGINGIDISTDGGMNWRNVSRQGFNTCIYSRELKTLFFAGNKSGVGKISF